jgi:hypothetical protein
MKLAIIYEENTKKNFWKINQDGDLRHNEELSELKMDLVW